MQARKYGLFFQLLLFCSINVFAVAYPEMQDRSDRQERSTDSLQELLHNTFPDSIKVDLLCQLSNRSKDVDNKKALQYAEEALQLANTGSDIVSKAKAYRTKARILNATGDYSESLYWSLQALRYCEQLADSNSIVSLYNNIGIIYNNLARYELAEKYLLKALAIEERNRPKNKDNMILSHIYGNLGITMMEKTGNLNRGIGYFEKVLQLEQNSNDYRTKALTLMNLGELYFRKQQYAESGNYFNRTFKMAKEHDMGEYFIAGCYQNLGKIALKENNLGLAQKYLISARDLAAKIGDHRIILLNYEMLGELYLKMKDAEKAVNYYGLYHTLKDSVNNENIAKQLKEITQGYEVEKRDQEILLLNKDNEINKTLRNSVIIALILVSVILIITAINVRQKQRANRSLKIQKGKIEQQNIQIEEKNKLLDTFNKELQKENIYARYEILKSKVNPHFLFNSLSSLAALIPQEPARALEFALRFSQLYRTIIDNSNLNVILLSKEIELVKNYIFLQQIRFHKNLHIEFDTHTDLKKRYVPPFALQIVVENVIRHNIISDEKPLTIMINITNDFITVTNHFQPRKNVSNGAGFGQRNLMERYRIIGEQIPSFTQNDDEYVSILPILQNYMPEFVPADSEPFQQT